MAVIETDDYEQLRAALRKLPPTWYPDLTRAIVEEGYAQGTWQDGGASRFVASVEKRLKADRQKGSS